MPPSARSILKTTETWQRRFGHRQPSGRRRGKYKRLGGATDVERGLVAQFVADQPHELTTKQINGLAATLGRSKALTLQLIDEAKEILVGRVGRYVDLHMQATETAVANGDAKSLSVATRAAEWAMENISVDGKRVVEHTDKSSSGTRVLIGVKIGGAISGGVQPQNTLIVEGEEGGSG